MLKIDRKPQDKLFKRLQKFMSVTYYFDYHNLSGEEVLEKYGYFGMDFPHRIETRFRAQDFAFEVIDEVLNMEEEYYFIPVTADGPAIYMTQRDEIRQYMGEYTNEKICHFIVIDTRFRWLMVKNDDNEVIGSGNIVRDKLKSLLDNIDYKKVFFLYQILTDEWNARYKKDSKFEEEE